MAADPVYPVDQDIFAEGNVRYYKSHDDHHRVIVKDFLCEDINAMARHIREGVVTAEIAHPNICKMFTMFPTQESSGLHIKLVFEFCDRTLLSEIEDRRKRNPPLYYTEEELRSFLSKIASALQFAHSRGVAHRDINPEHIYTTPDGNYKLSDFGASWREDDHKAYSRTLTGQPTFMCPIKKRAYLLSEQLVYDPKKSDVYSLGVTLLFMGRLFSPDTLRQIPDHEANVNVLLANMTDRGVSLQFAEIIRNMLRVEEADRFDIDNVLEALSLPNPPPTMFALTPSQLYSFNFPEDRWKTVALTGSAIQVNEHTATTVLNSETLFCCGGGNRPCKCLSRQEDLYRDS